jgi:hypothetical protein
MKNDQFNVTRDLEIWGWIANGLNILLAHSILNIGDLEKDDADDVQNLAIFSQELNRQLLDHYQNGGA